MSHVISPRGWRRARLQELVFFQRGFDITQSQQSAGVVPVISSSGITSYHDESKVAGPGVVIGRKGTLGSIHFTLVDYWPHDTTLWSKDFRDNDPRFVYYYLHMLDFKRFDVGNSNPTLNRNHIHDIPVAIPPRRVQSLVVEVLTAYDDLIENNRRRMALLEKSARLLYREWFIRLRFPGYEHTRIVDGVPQGWERRALSDLTSFLKRGIAPTYDDEAEGLVINQKCIRDGRVSLEFARHQSKEVKPERLLQLGDVLVNSTGEGTLGRVAQVKTLLAACTVDTHVTIVRPGDGVPRHYFGLAVMEWEPRFSTMGKGATNQTEHSPATIGDTVITVPSRTLLEQFELFAEPLYEQVTNLVGQSQKLRAARNLLLPRLMSGKIQV